MDSDTQVVEHKRIFLALWPDQATRQQLFELQKRLKHDPELNTVLHSARTVIPDNLHMTLHFIGSVSVEVVQALQLCLDSVQCKPFNMIVATTGCFPKPRVFWSSLKDTPPELNELEQQTAACVQHCMEDYRRIPYRPHITLFRKVKTLQQPEVLPEINWRVKSFALVESKTYPEGVQYRVLKQWPLS
ncbi:MAG: RNA 2',3'-cyclic phosphodiesterase [Gammaproteobacteria bacterium]|nr:RNA 2',3'-cyclic phosphodiesterase [Gammaproteobacteria bacterium]MCW8922617.1 RNA 2',3'-cyclic phosphodiesterase [Gammaproteobacteria bacterium]